MKGTYCIVLDLPRGARIRIGSLGLQKFPAGVYVYVGSALSGIERRVSRHARRTKKKRWHIDFLLEKADLISTISILSQTKETECAAARALLKSEGARVVVQGFGSSDCRCQSHLVHFGNEDPAWIVEEVARALAMLSCMYPSMTAPGRE